MGGCESGSSEDVARHLLPDHGSIEVVVLQAQLLEAEEPLVVDLRIGVLELIEIQLEGELQDSALPTACRLEFPLKRTPTLYHSIPS